jgi:hypothetical protein
MRGGSSSFMQAPPSAAGRISDTWFSGYALFDAAEMDFSRQFLRASATGALHGLSQQNIDAPLIAAAFRLEPLKHVAVDGIYRLAFLAVSIAPAPAFLAEMMR